MDEEIKIFIRLLARTVAELSERVAVLTNQVAAADRELSEADEQARLSEAQFLREAGRSVLAALEQAFPTTPSQRES